MQSSGPGGDRFSLKQTCMRCLTILGEFADTTLLEIRTGKTEIGGAKIIYGL